MRRRWNDKIHLSFPSEMKLDKSNCTFSYKLASGCRGSVSPVGFSQRLWKLAAWRHFQFDINRPINLEVAQIWHGQEGISKLQSAGLMPDSSVNMGRSPSVPNAASLTAFKQHFLPSPAGKMLVFKRTHLTPA